MWLLRDIPALLCALIGFWPLMILVITNGFKAMGGKKVPRSAYEDFSILLAHAEVRLDFALWREVYGRLSWDHRVVEFTFAEASDDWEETGRRFQSYQRAFGNLEVCARAYVHAPCKRYSINEREVSNGACSSFYLRSSSFGGHVAKGGNSPHDGMPRRTAAKAGGGSHSCCGPPLNPEIATIATRTYSARDHARISSPHQLNRFITRAR